MEKKLAKKAEMNYEETLPSSVLHWNYRGLTEFPLKQLRGEELDITDLYLKENLISKIPNDIGMLLHLESLYLSGNDITELPKEMSKLKCLKCLDVSGNRLKNIPNEIGDVKNLKFLILDENELTELPLRLAELRFLRYLSVCDNKLKWLPQRPVYNYHHCELRFWRNSQLKILPYSLWYHMFRNQQTRSLNIACLNVSNTQSTRGQRCRLKLNQDSTEWEYDIDCPSQYSNILDHRSNNPPTLYELSKRKFYQKISDAARKISTNSYSYYADTRRYNTENNNVNHLQNNFKDFSIKTVENYENNDYFVPGDVIESYFNYLPNFIKEDLVNGPVSKCENVECKIPVFDFVHYEFTMGKLILIDGIQEVILSAALCSTNCRDRWKKGMMTIPWLVVK